MSAGDTGLLDAASVVDSTPTTDTSTTDTSTSTTTNNASDLAVITADSEQHTEESTTEEVNPNKEDGTPKTEAEIAKEKSDAAAKGAGKEDASIVAQRSALKALKEIDGGKYAKEVASLHGAAERWAVVKDLLSNGPDGGINGLKLYFQALGGVKDLPAAVENLRHTNEMLESVKGTDELLYAGDPQLSENVYEDMKAQGKEDAYGKVVGDFLNHLQEVDSSAYYEVSKSHMVSGLNEAGLPGAINAIHSALASGDTAKAQNMLKSIANWYTGLRDEVGEKGKISKEREAWEKERGSKEAESQKAERGKVEHGVAEECERSSNVELGKFLGGFLRLPYFREFPRETKVDLGNGIKSALYAALKADKGYQSQMDSLWKGKTIDRAKMVQVHTAWLQSHGDALVRGVVQNRYPGYARGGSAAGKAAAATDKKAAAGRAAAQSVATGKAIFVASKPTNLIREAVKIAGREYSRNDLDVMLITGRGFVRTTDGKSVRLVSWRKQ